MSRRIASRARVSPRGDVRLLAGVLVSLLAACGSAVPGPVSTAGASGTTSGNVPQLSLTNVTTETAAASGTTIGPGGGTISARGSNGATYTLAIPAGALQADTAIAVYPVSKVAGLPGDGSLTAGAQFTPDGLRLSIPATFEIKLPSGADAGTLAGIAWRGDGVAAHPYPAVTAAGMATMKLLHFSGAGIGNGAGMPNGSIDCPDQASMDALIENDHARNPADRTAYTRDLRTCYRQYVAPMIAAAETYAEAHDVAFDSAAAAPDPAQEWPGIDAYAGWRLDVEAVDAWLGGGFDFNADLADSRVPAKNLLRAWYDAINDQCIADADPDMDTTRADGAILLADLALTNHYYPAERWGVDTVANKLDLETLLNDLCVKVVIDPLRDFSGVRPGDSGTVVVPIGYRIAGGPTRHDRELQLEFGLAGSQERTIAFSDVVVDQPFTWPATIDPLQIELLARMPYPFGDIARFDRITKRSGPGRIAFISMAAGGSYGLSVMDPDGTNVRRVIDSGNGGPAWSRDGTKVALSVTGPDGKPGIEVIANVASESTPAVATAVAGTSGGVRPSWLPDGRIMFEIGGKGLWVVGDDGAGLQQVVPVGSGASVSPDGKQIAYVVATGSGDAPAYEIHEISADLVTERTLLRSELIGPQAVAWSPDGSKLAFYGWVKPDGRYDIFVISGEGGQPTQLTHSATGAGSYGPTWSPDGDRIAFVSDRAGSAGIYVMDADGSNQQLVFPNGLQPAWQP